MANLEGRVVVISGAAGATGRAAAAAFAAQGARLALVGRDGQKLADLAAGLSLPAGQVLAVPADLSDLAATRQAGQAVQAAFGRVDVLIHLVGGWTGGVSLAQLPQADLEGMLAQHAWSTLYAIQAFTPLMAARGWGRVIVVSSPLANHPAAGMGAYSAAKAAQEALVQTLAAELKDQGVTANILQTRAIDAGSGKGTANASRSSGIRPADLVAAMLYLCSDAASHINGVRIPLG